MIVTERFNEYLSLMRRRPDLFTPSEVFPIETDVFAIEAFTAKTGIEIGVIYKSAYSMLVVDLIRSNDGGYFAYERLVPTSSGKGVACVCSYDGKLVLIDQFRHATRKNYLSFVRGFGENGLSPVENAKKELYEEIKGTANKLVYLGKTATDTGLLSAEVEVFYCELASYSTGDINEGVCSVVLISENEFDEKIRKGEIADGITLSAYALYKAKKQSL